MRRTMKSGFRTETALSDRRSSPPSVWVLFRSADNRQQLLQAIGAAGMLPTVCSCFEEVKRAFENEHVDILVCEDQVAQETLRSIIELARKCVTPVPVVVASRTGEWDEFLQALRQGAFDYLVLPPRFSEVKRVLDLALREASGSSGNPKSSLANQISVARQLLHDFKIHAEVAMRNAAAALHQPTRPRRTIFLRNNGM